MKSFSDGAGQEWVATAHEEETPRHHGRWFLVFHPAGREDPVLPLPEVRWQTRATAERSIRTMSEVELRRRLRAARARSSAWDAARKAG
ncbi:MAG TPA: hypothetical protein VF158_15715 [Longimicrobiales bacterium]